MYAHRIFKSQPKHTLCSCWLYSALVFLETMPSALSLLCILPILFSFSTTILAAAQTNKSEVDRQELLCFKSGISSDPLGILRSWSNYSLNFCSWQGVTCGVKLPSRVVSLDLTSAQLSGQISGCIANLTSLSRINLTDNHLSGAIPDELGKLRDLQTLMLAGNNLEGNIPGSLGSSMSLKFVNLANNTLSGGIPHSLANSYSLNTIILSRNNLSGEIPATLFANSSALTMVDLQMNSLTGPIPPFGKVTGLQTLMLAGNNLEGSIPYSLGSSMSLSFVNLANNTLSGSIPNSLANIYSLNALILSRNNFSGEIPDTLFANSSALTMVDLQMNSLTGPIPPFGKVTGLKFLFITENFLSGSIPPSIGNVSSLTSILLGQNKLTGLIPESLSHIPKLLRLDLSFNSLSGHVPISVYNMSSLKYFSIGSNGLVGQIPSYIGYSLPNLQFLIMQSNKLEGLIPSSLANTSNLQVLDLSNNSLRGSVPSLGSLANLDQLLLGRNWLEAHDWAFLTSLENCTQLIKLSLEGNTLNGSLPRSVVNLSTRLERLMLGSNQISGSIPVEISNLVNLTFLSMENNLLSGSIPPTIGKLHNLVILNLSKNKLSGQIPSSVGNIAQLSKLYLDDNNLSGNIPSSLGQCLGLLQLNLSANNLDGFIPKELFAGPPLSIGADLSHNNLTGAIPSEVGLLVNIALLNISNNMLFGVIPEALGNCVSLSFLLMEGNKLQGGIPSSFESLRSLQQMNLSRNNLSGLVPEFFEAFTMLAQLDLSYNNFEGPVPIGGIFGNPTVVALEGNKKLCARVSMLALPICDTSAKETKNHVPSLQIVILIPLSTVVFLLLLCLAFAHWKRMVEFTFSRCNNMLSMLRFVALRKREVRVCPSHKETLKKVSYGDILKATNCFSSVHTISSTRTGSVYVGRFVSDRSLVAIKVFNLDEPGAYESYFTECEVLRSTRHRNIMRPVTLCSTLDTGNHEFKALIFKFMVNGSLERWLHSEQYYGIPVRVLSLGERICIAADVASALDYVHNQLTPPLIHCDLKPSNILLDHYMTARLGDFGSAKFLFPGLISPKSLVDVGGTIGYVAPEYGMGCEISPRGDVYSFGVLLLEMLTGKQPTDDMFVDGLSLHKFVDSMFPDRVAEILDPHMAHEEHQGYPAVWMQSYIIPLVALGLSCSMESPKDRPGMQDVCAKLSAIKESFSGIS